MIAAATSIDEGSTHSELVSIVFLILLIGSALTRDMINDSRPFFRCDDLHGHDLCAIGVCNPCRNLYPTDGPKGTFAASAMH